MELVSDTGQDQSGVEVEAAVVDAWWGEGLGGGRGVTAGVKGGILLRIEICGRVPGDASDVG